jgi:hypothetical protein
MVAEVRARGRWPRRTGSSGPEHRYPRGPPTRFRGFQGHGVPGLTAVTRARRGRVRLVGVGSAKSAIAWSNLPGRRGWPGRRGHRSACVGCARSIPPERTSGCAPGDKRRPRFLGVIPLSASLLLRARLTGTPVSVLGASTTPEAVVGLTTCGPVRCASVPSDSSAGSVSIPAGTAISPLLGDARLRGQDELGQDGDGG